MPRFFAVGDHVVRELGLTGATVVPLNRNQHPHITEVNNVILETLRGLFSDYFAELLLKGLLHILVLG